MGSNSIVRKWRLLVTREESLLFPFADFQGIDFTDIDYIQVKFEMLTSMQDAVKFRVLSIWTCEPTLVELTELEAVPGSHEVGIYWATTSEIDTSGFNLYRAESEDGEVQKDLRGGLCRSESD
jgi:hypothetical protein